MTPAPQVLQTLAGRYDSAVFEPSSARCRVRLTVSERASWDAVLVDGGAHVVPAARNADATLTADLSADSMHELLLGTLPLGRAMLFRKLKVSGSKSRALGLEPLLHACQAVYPGIVDRRL